jgi:hypothetical protein
MLIAAMNPVKYRWSLALLLISAIGEHAGPWIPDVSVKQSDCYLVTVL